MLDIMSLRKNLKPVTVSNALEDGITREGYIYQNKFILKGLGNLNERLFSMFMIDVNEEIMEVTDREVYDLKICKVFTAPNVIGQWFYIKEE